MSRQNPQWNQVPMPVPQAVPTPVAAPGYPQYPAPVYPGTPQAVPMPGYPMPVPTQPVAIPVPMPAYPQPVPAWPAQPQAVPYPSPTPVPMPMPAGPQPVAVPWPAQPAHVPQPMRPQPVPVPVPQARQPVPVPVPVQPAAAPQPVPVARTLPVPVTAATAQPVPLSAARPVPVTAQPSTKVSPKSEEEEEAEKDVSEQIVKKSPPWLYSMLLHMAALILMALWYLPSLLEKTVTIEASYAEEIGEQLINETLDMGELTPEEVTNPVMAEDVVAAVDPLAAPPQLSEVVLDATSASSMIEAPSIGLALTGREKGMKQALLASYGGNATTEEAVRQGLLWLKKQQQRDGWWSLAGPYSNAGSVENRAAATAMALLAFQGAGHTTIAGDYKAELNRAWDVLLKSQDPDGGFFREGANHHRLYTQAQCTIALCELLGMTKDPKYRQPAQKALDFAVRAQAPEGGWRYVPKQDADTSVTGWFVMAFQSGKMAGLEIPSPVSDGVMRFLDAVSLDGGIHYGYRIGDTHTPSMTAEALLCRQYLGWKHNDPRLQAGVQYLLQNPLQWEDTDYYYWYYATQVLHHMEGEPWRKWNQVMRDVLPRNQIKDGAEKGSWDVKYDRHGSFGGRMYSTCLALYMLEVYYRHLPIYKYRLQ